MPQFIIPGKAFEALQSIDPPADVAKVLAAGEKRNKGRGYRVFVDMTVAQAQQAGTALARFAATGNPTPPEAVAYKTAIERLGAEPVKADSVRQDRSENHTYGIKLPDYSDLKPFVTPDQESTIAHIEATFDGKITVLNPRSPLYGQKVPGQRDEYDYKLLKDRYVAIFRQVAQRASVAA